MFFCVVVGDLGWVEMKCLFVVIFVGGLLMCMGGGNKVLWMLVGEMLLICVIQWLCL